eukprot:scaffold43391_cov39-Prasinocladus_malaysianus.AAC.1
MGVMGAPQLGQNVLALFQVTRPAAMARTAAEVSSSRLPDCRASIHSVPSVAAFIPDVAEVYPMSNTEPNTSMYYTEHSL